VGGALTAVLLLAVAVAAAAVLTARAATAPAAAAPSPVPLDVRARVAAPGLVLSRAPAGVVAAWPTAVLTVHGRRAALHLELPTANCLQPQAPAAPDGSGCLPTGTRAGELTTPALRVTRSGSRLVASGTVPMPTGQRYDVTVALAPSPAGDGTVGNRGTLTVRAAGR
jgi:hypothetical protein